MQAIESTQVDQLVLDELDDGWDARERALAHRVALLQAYFARFGLVDAQTSQAAARRVLTAVLETTREQDEAELDRRLVKAARTWIRDFTTGDGAADGGWVSRASVLLAKFPSAFLATPLTYQSH